jgi:dipeptidyl aminopeptidase/acylaminoacyl peptidase
MRVTACLVAVLGGLLPGAAANASCLCRPVADYGPTWSPTDTAIAYKQAFEARRVFSFTDGSDAALTPYPLTGDDALAPDWSLVAEIANESVAPGVAAYALVILRPDGSERRRLDSSFATPPAWSPSSDRIAYVGADQGLYTVRPDGTDRRRVASHVYPYGAQAASWSPDGSLLAFTDGKDLYVVPAEGGEARAVSAGVGGIHADPAWSPSGDRLAFVTDFGTAIDVVRIDGTPALHVLAQLPVEYGGTRLSWSPDGSHLLYSHRWSNSYPSDGIYEIDGSSGAQRTVAAFGLDASYSHDGRRIAFGGRITTLVDPATLDCVGVGIWVVPSSGGRPSLATRTCTRTPPTVSIHAPGTVVYGTPASLSGALLPGSAPFLRGSERPCRGRTQTMFTPATDGYWSRPIAPNVTTRYTAASDVDQVHATVLVRPRVTVRQTGQKLGFEVTVEAARSFAGRSVRVNLTNSATGKAVSLRRVVLRSVKRTGSTVTTSARFRLSPRMLQPWQQSLWAVLPKQVTGPCLASGISDAIAAARP